MSSRMFDEWSGSSPLTRGKLRLVRSLPGLGRLIPAHAGKTPLNDGMPRYIWAHPRSRGENEFVGGHRLVEAGSSPLTRGKRYSRVIGPPQLVAHPRSRGENLAGAGGVIAVWGSSPLTRGKLDNAGASLGRHGLIPAHAGKTRRWPRRTRPTRAHPRSRGENLTK